MRSSTLTSLMNLSFILWILSALKPLEFFLNCTGTNHNDRVKMDIKYTTPHASNKITTVIVGTSIHLKTQHTPLHACISSQVYTNEYITPLCGAHLVPLICVWQMFWVWAIYSHKLIPLNYQSTHRVHTPHKRYVEIKV